MNHVAMAMIGSWFLTWNPAATQILRKYEKFFINEQGFISGMGEFNVDDLNISLY